MRRLENANVLTSVEVASTGTVALRAVATACLLVLRLH